MSSSQNDQNKSILIVDDEPDVLEFLKLYLGSLGWLITTSTSTVAAIQLLIENRYFMVISDIAMPDMDGYEFITRMREISKDAQVALMTGFGYNPHHTLVKLNKSVHYPILFKPFNRNKLAETVALAWETFHKNAGV